MAIRSVKGQGLAEYALILALIAVLCIAAVLFLGGQIQSILSTVGSAIYPTSWDTKRAAPGARPALYAASAPGSSATGGARAAGRLAGVA